MLPRTVGIIGGGASGALAAIHVRRTQDVKVVIIEPRADLGRGVAYSTTDDRHLLNVRAGRMSAFPDDPAHFARWAGVPDAAFLPRRRYGEYLHALLGDVRHVQDRAVTCEPAGDGVAFGLAGGGTVRVDRAVLAGGASPAPGPAALRAVPARFFVTDPWSPGALESVSLGAPVLLVGTGLTAVDVALSLAALGHGHVFAASRHGLLPTAHQPVSDGPPIPPPDARTAAGLVAWMRAALTDGADWRRVVDSLREHTNRIWAELPDCERARLIRHAHRQWEISRHRMAPPVAASVGAMMARGSLAILRGRVRSARVVRSGVQVDLDGRCLRVGAIVNCTGPSPRIGCATEPLLRHLLAHRVVRAGPLGLGLATDPDGAIPGTAGRLAVVGPLRRGDLWETTAIPEIRMHAAALPTATA